MDVFKETIILKEMLSCVTVVSLRQIGVAYVTATSTALATAVGLNLYTKVQTHTFSEPAQGLLRVLHFKFKKKIVTKLIWIMY